MSKFNTTNTRPVAGAGPIATDRTPSGHTYEGAPGYARDLRSELFLLAVSNVVGEQSFYERAGERDDRYAQLVRQAATDDVAWLIELVRWLRNGGNMRSASLVAAAEGIKARLDAGAHGGNRQLVDACMARADEPGEFLAYWRSRFGRTPPQPVKNGLGDVARRLYTERSVLKYDTPTKGYRFADVIELVRPEPTDRDQDALFEHLLARRHTRPELFRKGRLPLLRARAELDAVPADRRRELLGEPERLRAAGMTWEALSAWLGGKMDRAAWEAIIPSMPYMALLRNLRNFDQAGVSDATAAKVAERLADPEQVARSRQFPFRFLAAYRHAPSLRWGHALDRALTASLASVPELDGRTLLLVDRSGSMFGRMSRRSELTHADSAVIFGAALAMRNLGGVTLVQYGSGSKPVEVRRGESLLKVLGRFEDMGGTETAGAVARHYANHDRVVIVTDEQAWAGYGDPGDRVPATVPLYTFNLVGYRRGHQGGGPNRVTIGGGLTDHAFRLIPWLEAGKAGVWPWLEQPAA